MRTTFECLLGTVKVSSLCASEYHSPLLHIREVEWSSRPATHASLA